MKAQYGLQVGTIHADLAISFVGAAIIGKFV